jgi:hypothetical protein
MTGSPTLVALEFGAVHRNNAAAVTSDPTRRAADRRFQIRDIRISLPWSPCAFAFAIFVPHVFESIVHLVRRVSNRHPRAAAGESGRPVRVGDRR